MKQATLEEAARTLAELVAAVRAGETVVITEDGVAVAELVQPVPWANGHAPAPTSIAPEPIDWDERLDRLAKAGIIRRASQPPLKLDELPDLIPLSGVLDALLEERREGR